jgi:hypothetical protein
VVLILKGGISQRKLARGLELCSSGCGFCVVMRRCKDGLAKVRFAGPYVVRGERRGVRSLHTSQTILDSV